MSLEVDCNIDFLEVNSYCVNYKLPIVSYSLPNYESINNTLITIIDNIEKFYVETKYNTVKDNDDGATKTKSILTHNYKNFNIFDHTEYEAVNILKSFISNSYMHYINTFIPNTFIDFKTDKNKIGINCWGNKIGRYDYLSRHRHREDIDNPIPSANYFVKSPGHTTYTKYYHPLNVFEKESWILPNKEGTLTLFPNFVEHETSANRSPTGNRYTLGMDAYVTDMHREISKCVVSLFN